MFLSQYGHTKDFLLVNSRKLSPYFDLVVLDKFGMNWSKIEQAKEYLQTSLVMLLARQNVWPVTF